MKSVNFRGTPFHIEYEKVPTKPGCWDYTKVYIFNNDIKIGEYTRNYSSFYDTFYPFQVNEDWFALCSTNYTVSEVYKLTPKFEYWCGETPNPGGFCPVDFYVPRYRKTKQQYTNGLGEHHIFDHIWHEFHDVDVENDEEWHNPIVDESCFSISDIIYTPFAFVAGCIWGDDSSWKIEFIDLSDIVNKKFNRTNKFGYIELPHNQNLKEAINMRPWEEDSYRFFINTQSYYEID